MTVGQALVLTVLGLLLIATNITALSESLQAYISPACTPTACLCEQHVLLWHTMHSNICIACTPALMQQLQHTTH